MCRRRATDADRLLSDQAELPPQPFVGVAGRSSAADAQLRDDEASAFDAGDEDLAAVGHLHAAPGVLDDPFSEWTDHGQSRLVGVHERDLVEAQRFPAPQQAVDELRGVGAARL